MRELNAIQDYRRPGITPDASYRLAVDVLETARLLSLSKHTVRAYIRRGLIRAVRVGRRVLVPVSECERIVREGIHQHQEGGNG